MLVETLRSRYAVAESAHEKNVLRRAFALLGVTPPNGSARNDSDYAVRNVPLDEIRVDKARFQPRDDFSEGKVSEIVQNFNPALFKPLIVWRDPNDGKTYLLAGHHRYEALRRMGRRTAPVVYAEGNERKAVEIAWTENMSGRSQTAAENAKYLRMLAQTGKTRGEIETECKSKYDRSCTVALDLSHLNPRGNALVNVGLAGRDSELFRDLETMAQWVGKIRGRNPDLTDSHENEIYEFLKENYKLKGKKFTNSADFTAFIQNIVEKRTQFGKIDERLNINGFVPQTAVAAEYDAEIARAERELQEAKRVQDDKQKEAAKKLDAGSATQEQVDAILKKYNDAVILAAREVMRLKDEKHDGVRAARESEMALFGLVENHDLPARLLKMWNDSTLSSAEREKVRRAAVLLDVPLPEAPFVSIKPVLKKSNQLSERQKALWVHKHLLPTHQRKVTRPEDSSDPDIWELERVFADLYDVFHSIPKLRAQDGQGGNAIAYLHFFFGTADIYVIEGDGRDEFYTFGSFFADGDFEYGYQQLEILQETCADKYRCLELDFYFDPIPLFAIKDERNKYYDETREKQYSLALRKELAREAERELEQERQEEHTPKEPQNWFADYDHFFRSTEEFFRNQIIAQNEGYVAKFQAQIEELQKVPESWQGTKKDYLESVQEKIAQLRGQRDNVKTSITRYRNNEPSETEQRALDKSVRKAFDAQSGTLTDEQRQFRLQRLMQIVFSEESADEQFYPTPSDVVEEMMLPLAAIKPGMRVLEPSAGKGDIADSIRAKTGVSPDVVELNPIRAEVLRLKGYNVLYEGDFMDFAPETDAERYDVIVMNPPFLRGVNIRHVRHAFDKCLKPGGKLVAIMGARAIKDLKEIDAASFYNFLEKRGAHTEIIPRDRYNRRMERKIMIDIALIAVQKPLVEERVQTEFVVERGAWFRDNVRGGVWQVQKSDRTGVWLNRYPDNEEQFVEIRLSTARFEAIAPDELEAAQKEATQKGELPDRSELEKDAGFREPRFIVARAQYSQHPKENRLAPQFAQVLKPHQLEGVNLAIEALDSPIGGFLNSDGTGAGKSLQELALAYHYVSTTGKGAVIFTESDQIMQQSLFGDARRLLGLPTPDAVEGGDECENPQAPKTYKGLYGLYDAPPKTNNLGLKKIPVVAFNPKKWSVEPGAITVAFYHHLSLWGQNHPTEQELKAAIAERKQTDARYAEQRKRISDLVSRKKMTGDEAKREREALRRKQDNDPIYAKVVRLQIEWENVQAAGIRAFTDDSSLIILDESHSIKNTTKTTKRAQRGKALCEEARRVAFFTATPTDKAGDCFYLKRAGLYRSESEWKQFLTSIGYEFHPAKRNDKGDIIRQAEWRPNDDYPSELAAQSVENKFASLTEDGLMIKREIELVNMKSPVMVDIPLPASIENELFDIADALDSRAVRRGRKEESKAVVLKEQQRYLEKYKIEKTMEITREKLAEGRSVIIFCDLVDDGEEKKEWGETRIGTIETLKARLETEYGEDIVGLVVGVSNNYEFCRRLANIQEFQKGDKRVILCTYGSGGTGISLDDTIGNMPRTVILMTVPPSAIPAVQAFGRVVRTASKSRAEAYALFGAGIDVEVRSKNLLATKMMMLGAAVSGQVSLLNPREVDEAESAGYDAVAPANLVADEKHSLWKAREIKGENLPSGLPYTVTRSEDRFNITVRIGAKSRDDINRFALEYKEMIQRFALKRDSNPYQGTFYEFKIENYEYNIKRHSPERVRELQTEWETFWNYVLNWLKPENTKYTLSQAAVFEVGNRVTATEDIIMGNVRKGDKGRVARARERERKGAKFYLYDVEWEKGTETKNVYEKSIELVPAEAKAQEQAIEHAAEAQNEELNRQEREAEEQRITELRRKEEEDRERYRIEAQAREERLRQERAQREKEEHEWKRKNRPETLPADEQIEILVETFFGSVYQDETQETYNKTHWKLLEATKDYAYAPEGSDADDIVELSQTLTAITAQSDLAPEYKLKPHIRQFVNRVAQWKSERARTKPTTPIDKKKNDQDDNIRFLVEDFFGNRNEQAWARNRIRQSVLEFLEAPFEADTSAIQNTIKQYKSDFEPQVTTAQNITMFLRRVVNWKSEINATKDDYDEEKNDLAKPMENAIERPFVEIRHNLRQNGIELKFEQKPSDSIILSVKTLGYRWSNKNGVWYARFSLELLRKTKELLGIQDVRTLDDDAPFEENSVSLQENGEKSMVSIRESLPQSLQESLSQAITRFQDVCAIPSSLPEVIVDLDEDFFDIWYWIVAEYQIEEATILLNIGKESEELLLAIFWHEYAHHVFFKTQAQESKAWKYLREEVKQSTGYERAVEYDEREKEQYWTSEIELWARIFAQFFIFLTESGSNRKEIIEILEQEGFQQWDDTEFRKLIPLMKYTLQDLGFEFKHEGVL